MAVTRIYVTGRLAIERGPRSIDERELSGRQARLALAFLVAERHKPVAKERLTSVLWPEQLPSDPEAALSAILSKLRSIFRRLQMGPAAIDVLSGSVQLRLPPDVWVDLEHAGNSIDEAEGALRASDIRRAWSHAVAVTIIGRRPFLAGENAPWIESRRAWLRALLVRGLHILSQVSLANRELGLALQYANELVELEPFQETGYRRLMETHAVMGNRAEALRVFSRCRELFRDELGAAPSPETERVFLEILRAEA